MEATKCKNDNEGAAYDKLGYQGLHGEQFGSEELHGMEGLQSRQAQ